MSNPTFDDFSVGQADHNNAANESDNQRDGIKVIDSRPIVAASVIIAISYIHEPKNGHE